MIDEIKALRTENSTLRREIEALRSQLLSVNKALTTEREALNEILLLCMDVPEGEDWRKLVGDKARKALYGDPTWKTK